MLTEGCYIFSELLPQKEVLKVVVSHALYNNAGWDEIWRSFDILTKRRWLPATSEFSLCSCRLSKSFTWNLFKNSVTPFQVAKFLALICAIEWTIEISQLFSLSEVTRWKHPESFGFLIVRWKHLLPIVVISLLIEYVITIWWSDLHVKESNYFRENQR